MTNKTKTLKMTIDVDVEDGFPFKGEEDVTACLEVVKTASEALLELGASDLIVAIALQMNVYRIIDAYEVPRGKQTFEETERKVRDFCKSVLDGREDVVVKLLDDLLEN